MIVKELSFEEREELRKLVLKNGGSIGRGRPGPGREVYTMDEWCFFDVLEKYLSLMTQGGVHEVRVCADPG
jgi:hypothetical protein